MKKRWLALSLASIICVCLLAVPALADGEGEYRLPAAGTETLDLSDKAAGFSFTVYDDGGAEADYSDRCNGALLIAAPPDCLFSVSGSGVSEASCDYLYLYDGDTAVQLCGEQSGEIVVNDLRSAGSALKIAFVSDSSTAYAGFALTVTLLDRADYPCVTYLYDGGSKSTVCEKGTEITLASFASLFTLPERFHFDHWQCGDGSYAEGDAWTMTADVAFTAVLAEDPVILHGEAGAAYANYPNYALLPKQTSVTADLSGWQAGDILWVFDNGGLNGNYANNCNGSLTAVAPEGLRICVRSDVTTEQGYDTLRVYDGATTEAALLGGPYSGTTTITPLYSTGSAVTVNFRSDGSSTKRGVDMKILLFDPSSLHTLSFDAGEGSGAMDSISGLAGDTVRLPACGFTCPDRTVFDYYTDGTARYNANERYTFGDTDATLTAVYADTVVFTYENGLEDAISKVYRKGTAPALNQYSSYADPLFWKTPYRKEFRAWRINGEEYAAGYNYPANADTTVTAVFNELPILIDDGNGGKYILMPAQEAVAFSLEDQPNGFTFHFYDNGGANSAYANNCNGSMTLTAPAGYVFSVSGSGRTESGYDLLHIYDSDGTTALADCQGVFTVEPSVTAGNALTLAFTSDSSSQYSGFDLTVMLYDPATQRTISFAAGEDGSGAMDDQAFLAGTPFSLPACGFTAPSSVIFAGWTDGTDTWQEGEAVTFSENKQLTATWAESCGVTYAYNGSINALRKPKGAAITLPAFSDYYTLPAKMQFSGWMEHYSGAIYQAGEAYVLNEPTQFDAVVEAIPIVKQDAEGAWYALMPHDSSSWLSSERADLSGKPVGFSFHLYDDGGKDGDYALDYCSVLTIVAPEDCFVKVSGSGTTEGSSTFYDYLTFYDGQTNQADYIGNARYGGGNGFTVPALVSTGRYLAIQFVSDTSVVNAGFDLTVTIVPAVPKVTVTLDGSGAEIADGIENPLAFDQGEEIELPPGRMVFTRPAGKVFGGWRINGVVFATGETYTVTEDVTAAAVWEDITLPWDMMAERLNAAPGTDLGTIVLTEDLIAGVDSVILALPAGVTATIDLAGHTVDGSAAVSEYGDFVINVEGTLTLIDSVGGGTVSGCPLQVFGADALTAPESILAGYAASVEVNYRSDDVWERFVSLCYPTAQEALRMAWGIGEFYEAALPAHDSSETYVVLLADAVIPAEENWQVSSGDYWINLDLNGHTFDVQGTLSGAARIYIDSGVPGEFRSSGTIGVELLPYSADAYFITGGEIRNDLLASDGNFTISGGEFWGEFDLSGGVCTVTGGTFLDEFCVYGGTCTISGGAFPNYYVTLDNYRGNPVVLLSGSAEIAGVWLEVDTDKDSADMRLTVSGDARVAEIRFETDGAGAGAKPTLFLNGGYFGQDPIAWKNNNAEYFTFRFADVPEQYNGQQSWAADGADYPWRIDQAGFATGIVLPSSLSGIAANAFEGNRGIKAVYVPDACAGIGAEAFKGCTGLIKIRLPKDCTISGSAFDGCTSLIAILAPADGTTESWANENGILFLGE